MELFIFILFVIALVFCLLSGYSVNFAILFAVSLVFLYGLKRGSSWREMLYLTIEGAKKSRNLAITLSLVGLLSASWRACGSIAYIVFYLARFSFPWLLLPSTFLFCGITCCFLGSRFGTVATLGAICMTLGVDMGIPPALIGGAALSGCYLGDRCSPISSTSLLVAGLTKTNTFFNAKRYISTSTVPFVIAILLFLAIGLSLNVTGVARATGQIYADNFNLSSITLLPIVFLVLLAFFRFEVKRTLCVSTLLAVIVALFCQKVHFWQIPGILFNGFTPTNPRLDEIIGGGGFVSVWQTVLLVVICSCLSSLFKGTNFLDGVKGLVYALHKKVGHFFCILTVATMASAISCNIALSVILTRQLCGSLYEDKSDLALDLKNTAVILHALIPWSIDCAMLLEIIRAPLSSAAFAFFPMALVAHASFLAWRKRQKQLIEQNQLLAVS